MEGKLKIALVQTDNAWEQIGENLRILTEKMNSIDPDTDLILLPELFTTGFTMAGENASETMEGSGVQWMLEQAGLRNCALAGSLLIRDKGSLYNRLLVAFPDGSLNYYDKRHLFSFAGEDKVFRAGTERLVFTYKGFRICPLICYDLRFPVWSRNTEDFDLLLYVANWPNARITAWDSLLKARAIENLCYVAAVNRVGRDQNNLVYTGHSAVFDAMGNQLLEFDEGSEAIGHVMISKDHIAEVRDKFRFLEDRDSFRIL